MEEQYVALSYFPTEILENIFYYLPAVDLMKFRHTCHRFKSIADRLMRTDMYWQDKCMQDFRHTYKGAREKARPGLLWYNLYRSLFLWAKLKQASERRLETYSIVEEIYNFKIFNYDTINVKKSASMTRYTMETLELLETSRVRDHLILLKKSADSVIIHTKLFLFIQRSRLKPFHDEQSVTLDNVKLVLHVDRVVFFTNTSEDVFKICLDAPILECVFIQRSNSPIMSLSFTNTLHVLTISRNIFSLHEDELLHATTLGPETNLIDVLWKFNLLEKLDWNIYHQWMIELNQQVPRGPLSQIVIIHVYGNVVFVGTNSGDLLIYYSPFINGEMNLYNSTPVKQYCFMEQYDWPIFSVCPILQVDVVEGVDGHIVIIAMPKKMAILKYRHFFGYRN